MVKGDQRWSNKAGIWASRGGARRIGGHQAPLTGGAAAQRDCIDVTSHWKRPVPAAVKDTAEQRDGPSAVQCQEDKDRESVSLLDKGISQLVSALGAPKAVLPAAKRTRSAAAVTTSQGLPVREHVAAQPASKSTRVELPEAGGFRVVRLDDGSQGVVVEGKQVPLDRSTGDEMPQLTTKLYMEEHGAAVAALTLEQVRIVCACIVGHLAGMCGHCSTAVRGLCRSTCSP